MSRMPGTVRATSATAFDLRVELLEAVRLDLDDQRREVAVREHAGDQAARPLQELDARIAACSGSRASCRRSRAGSACGARRRASATRMKPMCGPLLGLVIALRALPGEPTLVSTSSTVPWRQLLGEQRAHPVDLLRRVLQRRARREADVDALHRLVDLGEERARAAAWPSRRWRRPARGTRPGSASDTAAPRAAPRA